MKKQLLILTVLFISVIGYSQTFSDNYINYTVNSVANSTVTVLSYSSASPITDVVIPATVINNNITYTTTVIGTQAFTSKSLTSVSIPNTVTIIEGLAFTDNMLSTVMIPNSVTTIGYAAFGVNTLTSIVIPDSVTSLGDSAFSNNSLTNVTISSNLTFLDTATFAFNNLSSVTLPSNITDIGNNVFNGNPLTCVISEATTAPTIITGSNDSFGNRSNIDLSIPSGTASAYAAATWTGFNSVAEGLTGTFVIDNITYQINATPNNEVTVTNYNTAGGTNVTIPATVTSACTDFSVTNIGNLSFINKGINSIMLPNSITSIGNEAFRNNNVVVLVIPDNVTIIEDAAFAENLLNDVTLPSGLIDIGPYAFGGNQLTDIVIPNSVTTLGSSAFLNNQLTSFTLSNNLSTIEFNTFKNNQLVNISIPSNITDIEYGAFSDNQLTNVSLTNGIVTIGTEAFRNNMLTSISFPDSVTNITGFAFQNNPLTDIYTESITPPTIVTNGVSDSFNIDRSTIHLHIPPGTMGAYVTDAGALWTGFNPVTEDALSVTDFELANGIKVITTTGGLEVISNNSVKLKNYTIYSITGAKVKAGKETTIATTTLSNGIYILKLDFDKGTLTKKIVVN